ncbi:hypothetical protein YC2023_119094 [Brassica napus]
MSESFVASLVSFLVDPLSELEDSHLNSYSSIRVLMLEPITGQSSNRQGEYLIESNGYSFLALQTPLIRD